MLSENADELWDLYTKDREKTGLVHRRGDAMPAGKYRLAVHVCIFNSKNQLLIQQRQPFKKGWPNMWDVSVGGSATAGDTSAQAAQREVMEELGLALDLSDARPFFTMNFSRGFDDFYIIEQDVDLSGLHLQKSEVKQVRWADREEVMRLQEQGIMIPYWFLDRLFEIRLTHKAYGGLTHKIRVMSARAEHVESWMSLAEILKQEMAADGETGKRGNPDKSEIEPGCGLEEYRKEVLMHIIQGSAVCAVDGHMVVGFLLYAPQDEKPSGMAVHPEYRGQGIAARMVRFMEQEEHGVQRAKM